VPAIASRAALTSRRVTRYFPRPKLFLFRLDLRSPQGAEQVPQRVLGQAIKRQIAFDS
jgi:hypothetical protein